MPYLAMTLCRATCPTCQDATPGRCCGCGRRGQVEVRPWPYADEIQGDDTKHALCDDCCDASAAEI